MRYWAKISFFAMALSLIGASDVPPKAVSQPPSWVEYDQMEKRWIRYTMFMGCGGDGNCRVYVPSGPPRQAEISRTQARRSDGQTLTSTVGRVSGRELQINMDKPSEPKAPKVVYDQVTLSGSDQGVPFNRLLTFKSGGNGFADFLNQNGGPIATGIVNFFESKAIQAAQQEYSRQLEAAYREGRAVNGRYVVAVDLALAQMSQQQAEIERNVRLDIALLSQNMNAGLSTAEQKELLESYTDYLVISGDKYATKSYGFNQVAVDNISGEIRTSLGRGDFRSAAESLEGLQYNQEPVTLSADIRNLFNERGIVEFEKFDPKIPVSPLSATPLQTEKSAPEGQVVRRVANRYQSVWAESAGLANWSDESKMQYLAGLGYVVAADKALATHDSAGATYLHIANGLLEGAQGFKDSVAREFQNLVTSVPVLTQALKDYAVAVQQDPSKILTTAYNVLVSLPDIADAVMMDIIRDGDTILNGTARERGQVIGKWAFQVAVNFATEGALSAVGTAAGVVSELPQVARAKEALSAATASLKENAYAASKIGASAAKNIEAVRHMPKELRAEVIGAIRTDARKAFDSAGTFRRALEAGHDLKAAEQMTSVAMKTDNRAARDYLNRLVTASGAGENAPKYFKSAADAERLVDKYVEVHGALGKVKGETIEGYQARFGSKQYNSVNKPEGVFKTHDGNTTASGRFAPGGAEGVAAQSSGFSFTSEAEALAGARAEVASYGYNPEDMVSHVQKVKLENVLKLDGSVLEQLGLDTKSILIKREEVGAYEITQMIGHAANDRGFRGILAPSAADLTKNALHQFF